MNQENEADDMARVIVPIKMKRVVVKPTKKTAKDIFW